MADNSIYSKPRYVSDTSDCLFYHTIDLPGFGTQHGFYDLRGRVSDYLGHVRLSGKRVLEICTANGISCFYMEQQGAEVVAYDLSEKHTWDLIPFASSDLVKIAKERASEIRKLNNAYWLSHRLFESRAKVAYGTVYEVPDSIDFVDISTFGSILLHIRDPFLALQTVLCLTRETVIVSELLPNWQRAILRRIPLHQPAFAVLRHWHQYNAQFKRPKLVFVPNYRKINSIGLWWELNPEIIRTFLGILGFEDTHFHYHMQRYNGKKTAMYTIIVNRTQAPPHPSTNPNHM